jgi:electron transport complex protein RnfE
MNKAVYRWTGVLSEHPVFVSALGVAPLAASSSTLLSALTIGVTAAGVFLLSSLTVSALRRFIPRDYRLAYILVISATWVTVADLLLLAFLYEMRISLDIYIPLIAMNSLLLMLLEDGALRLSVPAAAGKTFAASATVFLVLVLTGLIRELLTHGALMTDARLIFPSAPAPFVTLFPESAGFALFDAAAGALIVLGCVLALLNFLSRAGKDAGGETGRAADED